MSSLSPDAVVCSEDDLRAIISHPSPIARGKKTAWLEESGRRFIGHAPFVTLTSRRPDGLVDVSAAGAAPGLVVPNGDQAVLIPVGSGGLPTDVLASVEANPFAGLLLLVPGVNETLRINGPAGVVRDAGTLALLSESGNPRPRAAIRVQTEEVFYHCAKAFVRSKLWSVAPEADVATLFAGVPATEAARLSVLHRAYIERAPFACLASSRADGGADVGPRGDPAGFVQVIDERTLLLPDRTGNRLADNFSNIVANPYAGLLFLLPGAPAALRVRARARVVRDEALLAPLAVAGKAPLVGLWLDIEHVAFTGQEAVIDGRLWDTAARVDRKALPSMGQLLADQLNPTGRFGALDPAAVDANLAEDSVKNLY